VRATASGFCYHQGAIWAGFAGPVLTYFAVSQPLGFAVPMLVATTGAAIMFVITLLLARRRRARSWLRKSPCYKLPSDSDCAAVLQFETPAERFNACVASTGRTDPGNAMKVLAGLVGPVPGL
jgi:hypothetical protein